jgi:hypothetical protein
MKAALLMFLLSFQSSRSGPLLAQLWPGEGAPSLFPPSAGQGLPQSAVGGEVAKTLVYFSRLASKKIESETVVHRFLSVGKTTISQIVKGRVI